jgi:hypothetical protein
MSNLLRDIIPGIAAIVIVVIYYRLDISRSESVLQRWAAARRFEILHSQRCFFSGGFRWCSHKQTVFSVKVRDDLGHEHSGWVRFGRFGGGGYDDEPDIIWREHETAA